MLKLAPLVLILNDNSYTTICNVRVANKATTKGNVWGDTPASLSALGHASHVSSERDTYLGVIDEYIDP